jgi:hypothetical protein
MLVQRIVAGNVTRSSPSLGPFSRGSSSDGLPSSVNMSARRVVAMAAIIGDPRGGGNAITPAGAPAAPATAGVTGTAGK